MKKLIILSSIFLLLLGAGCQPDDVSGGRTDSNWNNRSTYLETASVLGYNILINGTNKYLNFNSISGTTGYGFRDNSGTLQIKNSGGSWANISSGAGGGASLALDNLASVAINESLISDADITYDLGSDILRWDTLFSKNVSSTALSSWNAIYVGGSSTSSIYGDGATSTISGGLNSTYLNLTGNSATNTLAYGIKLAGGCFADASGKCMISTSAAGATVALDNLSGVAINESLISDTDVLDNLGSGALRWNTLYTKNVSSTALSALSGISVGRTATTTIYGSTTSTFGAGVRATHLYSTGGLTVVGGVVLPASSITYAMLANKSIGQWTNNTAYLTATSTNTLTNKSGTIGMWTNNTGYMTATSTNSLTNKSGTIGMWTNNTAYLTATSSATLTNKSGAIGQWTNNTGYTTVTSTPYYPAFTFPSTPTSTWAGTSTLPWGTAFVGETIVAIQCFTDTGTVDVVFHDGTNYMNLFTASTTVGTVKLTTNNTYTASEKRYFSAGNPASSPTVVSCTVSKLLN